jgi:hypothetical protein
MHYATLAIDRKENRLPLDKFDIAAGGSWKNRYHPSRTRARLDESVN